jgi:hypothetical protein
VAVQGRPTLAAEVECPEPYCDVDVGDEIDLVEDTAEGP